MTPKCIWLMLDVSVIAAFFQGWAIFVLIFVFPVQFVFQWLSISTNLCVSYKCLVSQLNLEENQCSLSLTNNQWWYLSLHCRMNRKLTMASFKKAWMKKFFVHKVQITIMACLQFPSIENNHNVISAFMSTANEGGPTFCYWVPCLLFVFLITRICLSFHVLFSSFLTLWNLGWIK